MRPRTTLCCQFQEGNGSANQSGHEDPQLHDSAVHIGSQVGKISLGCQVFIASFEAANPFFNRCHFLLPARKYTTLHLYHPPPQGASKVAAKVVLSPFVVRAFACFPFVVSPVEPRTTLRQAQGERGCRAVHGEPRRTTNHPSTGSELAPYLIRGRTGAGSWRALAHGDAGGRADDALLGVYVPLDEAAESVEGPPPRRLRARRKAR